MVWDSHCTVGKSGQRSDERYVLIEDFKSNQVKLTNRRRRIQILIQTDTDDFVGEISVQKELMK